MYRWLADSTYKSQYRAAFRCTCCLSHQAVEKVVMWDDFTDTSAAAKMYSVFRNNTANFLKQTLTMGAT